MPARAPYVNAIRTSRRVCGHSDAVDGKTIATLTTRSTGLAVVLLLPHENRRRRLGTVTGFAVTSPRRRFESRPDQPARHRRDLVGHPGANTHETDSNGCEYFAADSTAASAQTLDDLKNDGNGGSTDNVLTYGMGYHQQRYSPLKQINKNNVKRLVPVWSLEPRQRTRRAGAADRLQRRRCTSPTPEHTVAIDVATGKQIWRTRARLAARDPARRLLRRFQQGRGDLRRQGLPHHARRARRRARRQDRQGSLEDRRSPSGKKASRMTSRR